MADSGTSKQTRKRDEADIHEMRARGAKAKRRSLKRLIVPLVGVLVLGGGGTAAYMTFLAPKPQETAEAEPEPIPLPEPRDLAYVNLEPLFIPYRSAEGYHHKIALMVSLEVDRSGDADVMVRAQMPRIREAYLTALMDRPLPGTEDGSIEVVYLKNRIRAENLKLFGAGVINDVLIRDIRVVRG